MTVKGKGTNSAAIIFQLPPELKAEIVTHAKERGESVALICRELIRESLKSVA